MKNLLYHLFFPHEKNNYRSKLLHHTSLFVIAVFLLCAVFLIKQLKQTQPDILGISYKVTESRMLELTNQYRHERGLAPLTLSPQLSSAARNKASDMFNKNYWTHFAPDGTTPWYFIKSSGYEYLYAGENLAKGFTNSDDVVTAWMKSASHRENMLSDKYSDIGFAVVEGNLQGEDTVVVVEMFGSTQLPIAAQQNNPLAAIPTVSVAPSLPANASKQVAVLPKTTIYANTLAQQNQEGGVFSNPLIDLGKLAKSTTGLVIVILLSAFIIDIIIVERKKIPRLVGHNLDHIMIIILFLLFILVSGSGIIY